MAVQDEVPAGLRTGEAADQVGHRGLRRLGAMREALGVEEAAEELGRLGRVARRIAGVDAREGAQELDLPVALRVEPAQQLRARSCPGELRNSGLVHHDAVLHHAEAPCPPIA